MIVSIIHVVHKSMTKWDGGWSKKSKVCFANESIQNTAIFQNTLNNCQDLIKEHIFRNHLKEDLMQMTIVLTLVFNVTFFDKHLQIKFNIFLLIFVSKSHTIFIFSPCIKKKKVIKIQPFFKAHLKMPHVKAVLLFFSVVLVRMPLSPLTSLRDVIYECP